MQKIISPVRLNSVCDVIFWPRDWLSSILAAIGLFFLCGLHSDLLSPAPFSKTPIRRSLSRFSKSSGTGVENHLTVVAVTLQIWRNDGTRQRLRPGHALFFFFFSVCDLSGLYVHILGCSCAFNKTISQPLPIDECLVNLLIGTPLKTMYKKILNKVNCRRSDFFFFSKNTQEVKDNAS